ncbi:serine/threonine-protein kinase LMTK1-like isoform X2 [Ptychodera flava]|uniref:serine/threonine-protein kinase LMTK1-like isoform X2 n=1 Tax=Ptychodera flava TaxID=63121 RepID=UPI00396A4854
MPPLTMPFDERVLTDEQVVGNSYIDIGDFSTLNVDSLSADAVHQVAVDPLPSVQIQEARRNTNTSLSLSTVSGSLSHLQIPRTQLNYVAEIGSGWFGKVMTGEAMKLQAGLKKTKVIIKQLKDDASFEEKTQFLLEAQPYRELKHVNILPMVGQCTDSMPYLVVLDFCAFGDLKGFLLRRRSEASVLSQSGLLIRIACDIANGLEYMHRANMIHNDFAARSCLVAADMTVKIGDYGISQHRYKNDYYTSCHDIKMAIRWMAPETLDCQGDWVALRQPSLTKPANVWSFGVTLWELLSFGRRPYETLPDSAVLEKVFVEQSLKLQQPTLDIAFAERWYEIMQFCWLQYEQRPIMAELCALLKHLHHQTSALDQQTESFDEKWNSICPKKSPSTTVNMNATTSPVGTPNFESSFAPNTTNNNIPSKVQIPNNSMKVNSELAREFPRTSTPAAPVESRLNELPRTSTPAAPVESRLNELPRTSTPAAPVESRLNELPRTSTPAAPTESRLSDNRTSSSAMTNTSSSMYFSLNSTPTGNESGSDVFLTPRTSSRSPEEGAKAPKDAKISLSDVPPPASPPSDVDQSRSSAFSESSTMSLSFDDSSQSIDTTQLEIAVLDVGSSTDNQSKPINQANNDSQIEIKADVHMDSNIQALLSDSFDLDDSIADNLTFTDPATSDTVNQVPGDAITKEMISSSVLESPKGKTVITMQMPEDKTIW